MPFDGRPRPLPLVTAAQVSAIARWPDPVLRNLRITQSYHDLSVAIAERLGQRDVCWSIFAVWASKTAGRFIRGEWLRQELRALLERLGPVPGPQLAASDQRMRDCLAAGNQLVYAEIAPLFVTLVELLDTPSDARPLRLAHALDRLRGGAVEHGGQQALARALVAMVEAAALPHGPARAQRMLLANLLVGAHEQYRLQAAIRGALDAVWEAVPPPLRPWPRGVAERMAGWLRQQLTRWVVRVSLPGASLGVGRDVPALPDGSMFPPDLQRVILPELQAVLDRFDRTPNDIEGSAAADWADYGDRMNYVVDMFRSRQQTPSLWHAPFEPMQADAIRDGYVPAGRL